jgi:hypothetical protein
MKGMDRVARYVFIGFLVFGAGRSIYAGPMAPIIGADYEKESPESEAQKKLERLKKEIQKNARKTADLELEEKQQEAILKDIQGKLHQQKNG